MTEPLPPIEDGQAVNAARWNAVIDRVNAVGPVIEPTPWTALQLGFGWQPFGGAYPTLQYSLLGDVVRLRGVIRSTSANPANTRVATLPPDAQPSFQHGLAVAVGNNTSLRVDVLTTGEIRLLTATAAATTLLFDNTSIWLS